ncbi:MAG: hypothetical protein ACR2K1_08875 [Saprospiraceae bacterium]
MQLQSIPVLGSPDAPEVTPPRQPRAWARAIETFTALVSPASRHTFAKYAPGYIRLWDAMQIRPAYAAAVHSSAQRIVEGKARYLEVQAATGVPWWFVGIVHKMEGDLDFATHLHNGDSLKKRTWQVPAGRPRTGKPPFTWTESAIDALEMKKLHTIPADGWTLARVGYEFERFNGFGYRQYNIASPYLWSFSTNYTRGKYVRDGVWDSRAVSQQSGAMCLLHSLIELDASVRVLPDETAEAALRNQQPVIVDESERLPATPSGGQALARSKTIFGLVVAFVGWLVSLVTSTFGWVLNLSGLLSDIAETASAVSTPALQIAGYLGASLPWIGGAAVLYGVGLALYARISATANGKIG